MFYCAPCRFKNNWPGGFQVAREGPCESPNHVDASDGPREQPCYDYPAELLEGLPQEINRQSAIEKERDGV